MNSLGKDSFQRGETGYAYYSRFRAPEKVPGKLEAEAASREILFPSLRDPNYLVLRERRMIFSRLVECLKEGLTILDVGGRLQPYRLLLKNLVISYIALDPVFEGLVKVIGVGEKLPFRDKCFDLVICTQTLNYVVDPSKVIAEIHRVLKGGGILFLSIPAIFPRYHDQRWRFMPEGLAGLLSSFSEVQIVPEGQSIAGLIRSINLFLDTFIRSPKLKEMVGYTVFPLMNLAGVLLDRFSGGRTEFTTNYSCVARK
jgi:SAM-dependent methyltransferase